MVLNCGPQPQYNIFWGLRNGVTTHNHNFDQILLQYKGSQQMETKLIHHIYKSIK